MSVATPLYLGFDLSTQQLKGACVDSDLKLQYEAKVDFDADLSSYGIEKGVLTNAAEGEVFAPPAMWLDAVNLVLDRLKEQGLDFGRIKGLSGAGMQHGTVFWSRQAESLLLNLKPEDTLKAQLDPSIDGNSSSAFAHPVSPNWQDASTQVQCDAFDAELGDGQSLAQVTGSKAHHRFSGPQIMRYRTKHASHYEQTARISLVSSFLASVFLGKYAPIDISDVTGMNLWNIHEADWDDRLLALAAGGKVNAADLRKKLGVVSQDGGASMGTISGYFTQKYGFPSDCQIIPFTGDNPATILSLPLRPNDAIVSLGTSTTFLMSTSTYRPDPAYHFMNHPTTPGLYMFMLCYKNGGLAREQIRDAINNNTTSRDWTEFNRTALSTPILAQNSSTDPQRLGLYFPRPEIVPNLRAGQWRFAYHPESHSLTEETTTNSSTTTPSSSNKIVAHDARNIIESQFLSLRLRSHSLVTEQTDPTTHAKLPPQPRRVYLVGGGSANDAIAKISGQVLGGAEGVFKLDIGGNACALGAAYKALWGCERKLVGGKGEGQGEGGAKYESFDELIGNRWDEAQFVKRVADGYQQGVFERYGVAMKGFEEMENLVVKREGGSEGQRTGGQVFSNDHRDRPQA